jgi:hypothetical protein
MIILLGRIKLWLDFERIKICIELLGKEKKEGFYGSILRNEKRAEMSDINLNDFKPYHGEFKEREVDFGVLKLNQFTPKFGTMDS